MWLNGFRQDGGAEGKVSQMDELVVSVEEAAELMKVSRSTMYDLMRTRAIASIRVGRCRRIRVEALRAFLDQMEAETIDPVSWVKKQAS